MKHCLKIAVNSGGRTRRDGIEEKHRSRYSILLSYFFG